MEIDIDHLAESFSNSVLVNVYNPSSYKLYVENGGLYAQEFIEENKVLGELEGRPTYIWELQHNDYIIVDDELVLDIQKTKGNMLNFVREENMSHHPSNCFLYMFIKKNGDCHFYLISKEAIMPNEEIVYNAHEFVNEHE